MTYSDLMDLLETKHLLQKDLASVLGMTKNGLKYAVEHGTLQISKVLDLCNFAGISPNQFFSFPNSGVSQVQNGGVNNTQYVGTDAVSALESQLVAKDKQIEKLLELLAQK